MEPLREYTRYFRGNFGVFQENVGDFQRNVGDFRRNVGDFRRNVRDSRGNVGESVWEEVGKAKEYRQWVKRKLGKGVDSAPYARTRAHISKSFVLFTVTAVTRRDKQQEKK